MLHSYTRALALCLVVTICVLAGCDAGGDMDTVIDPGEDLQEVEKIELLSQLALDGGAGSIADIWGYVDPATGTEYALVGGLGPQAGRLYVVDVSDPIAPVLTAIVENVPGFDVKTYRQYAYTVTGGPDQGAQPDGRIIDLTNPSQPVVVGSFPSSHNLFITDEGLAFLEVPGLRIFDLSEDPLAPTLLWSDTPRNGHDATVVGDRLYDFHGGPGTFIYDIADPSNPVLLGTIQHPQITYHHSGWPTEDGQYLFLCDELATGNLADITVWDISRPEAPRRVIEFADPLASVHNLMIVGDLAYVSYYAAGFRVFDISDPAQPQLLGEYDTSPAAQEGFVGAWGVYPFAPSGNIYISDRQGGLFIFSVTAN